MSSDAWEPADWAELLLPLTSYIKLLVTRFRSFFDDNEAVILQLISAIEDGMALLPEARAQMTPT